MTETSTSTSLRTVTCKFRAPAALYSPSGIKGGGWREASRPGMGGEVMIQVQQEDAKWSTNGSPNSIAIVRFQLRHGKDVLNARIKDKLPIRRKDNVTVLFKCLSSTTHKIRKKTIFHLIFEKEEDTDDFLMWWYAKNGSIQTWLEGDESKKLKEGVDESKKLKENNKKEAKKSCSKRKATDSTNSGFTPLKKKLNKGEQDKALVESTSKKKKQKSGGSVIQKPTKKRDTVEEVVEFDYDDAPQSQNWMAAFQYE